MAKKRVTPFRIEKNLPPLTLGELANTYGMKKKDLRDVAKGLRDCGVISEDSYKRLLEEIKQI